MLWERLRWGPGGLVAGLLVGAGELLPRGGREIHVHARAAGAHVHDGDGDAAALVVHGRLLVAPLVGGRAGHDIVGGCAPSVLGDGSDHVGVGERGAASTGAAVWLVDGDVSRVLARAASR